MRNVKENVNLECDIVISPAWKEAYKENINKKYTDWSFDMREEISEYVANLFIEAVKEKSAYENQQCVPDFWYTPHVKLDLSQLTIRIQGSVDYVLTNYGNGKFNDYISKKRFTSTIKQYLESVVNEFLQRKRPEVDFGVKVTFNSVEIDSMDKILKEYAEEIKELAKTEEHDL